MAHLTEQVRQRVVDLVSGPSQEFGRLKVSDVRALVQELDSHQVELEQKAEDLRSMQLALHESRDRLSDLYDFAPVGYVTLDTAGVIRRCNLAAAQLLGPSRQRLVGKRLALFVPPAETEAFHRHFEALRRGESKVQFEVNIQRQCRPAGALHLRLAAQHSTNPVPDGQGATYFQVALIDITQSSRDRVYLNELNRGLEQAVAQRTADLSRSLGSLRTHEERLALALDAGRMGTWTLDLRSRLFWRDERHAHLYGHVLDPALDSLDGWLASLHVEDRERMMAVMNRAISGADPMLAAEFRVVRPDGSSHWLAVRGRVIFDARGKPRQIVGVEQDIDERKSLEIEVLQIADREQRRIGHELHDDIQQRLTGLGLMASSLCDTQVQRPATERMLCERLAQGIAETTERVNRLSHGLVPLELGGNGLVLALHLLAESTQATGQLACLFRHEAGSEVRDGFCATHLYRIAQEAITNATRHSRASRVWISLKRRSGQLLLTVSDDGVGFKPNASDGRGLRIMEYRASLIGATLRIRSARPSGTEVICAIPMEHSAHSVEDAA